ASDEVKAYRLGLHGTTVELSTSVDADAFRVAGLPTDVQLSISHLFDSIGHAMRHAMAQVTSAVVRWADDVGQWVVDLATTISDLATYAVTGMRGAFHVTGGWSTTRGADIVAAVNWLKREIFGFLSSLGK